MAQETCFRDTARCSRRVKRLVILALTVSLVVSSALLLSGCDILIEEDTEFSNEPVYSEDAMDNGYYIWHNDKIDNIMKDLKGSSTDTATFTRLYTGYKTFSEGESYDNISGGKPDRAMWLSEEELELVPTLYPGDELVLNASEYRPEEIIFERFYDEGWTFGVCGMTEDTTGRYVISTETEDDEQNWFAPFSEIFELVKLLPDTDITIDKVGGVDLRGNGVSDAGYVTGLSKNKVYSAEVYVGTEAYDTKFRADSNILVSRECFTSTDYTLVDSQTAVITIPNYLKTGYYYVDGEGLFRYVKNSYTWNESTDFNSPICTYDSEGQPVYDPMNEGLGETE